MSPLATALLLVLWLFLLFLPALSASAFASLYVDKNNSSCSDSGPGSQTVPFCSIGAAASKAVAGQTVQVASGTYSESVTVAKSGISGAPIVFQAAPGATVTITGGSRGFTISSKSWITISGFNITGTTGNGIYVTSSSNITIQGNHVSYSGQPLSGYTMQGIEVNGTTDSLITGNTTDHNSDAGIYLTNGTTRTEVRGNVSFSNARGYTRAAPGIDIRSSGNSVDGNFTYSNEDSGIQFSGAGSNVAYDNVTYNNGDHGIDDLNAPNQIIVSNTVYKNSTSGINVEGTSSGAILANNISVDNALPNTRGQPGNIRIDSKSVPGTTIDYDLVNLTSTGTMIQWNGVNYSSLSAFKAATGQEPRGIQADPKWKAPGSGDFHLTAGSPAIDSANSGAPDQPSNDLESTPRLDDPATPNTGAGPRAYDDRGAYEYRPPPDSPPAAALSVTPSSGTAPLQVTADASGSTDTDATPIATYSFDWGDGATTAAQPGSSATHSFSAAGTYTVTVSVADTAGLSSQATKQVVVSAVPPANLVGNPGFETNLTGWSNNGTAGVTLTQVTGGHSGSFAAKLTNTGKTSVSCTLNDNPNWVAKTSAGTYTGSLWVRADTAGAKLKLRFREYSNAINVGSQSASITLSTFWQQVTAAYVPQVQGSTLDFNAYVSGAPPGTCFYVDDASITRG